MPDFAAAYSETRDRLLELVRTLSDDELATTVPACPAWTIKDLVAHLCHVAESYTTGNIPQATGSAEEVVSGWSDEERFRARDAWTSSGVDARRDRTLDEIIAEWNGHAKVLCEMISGARPWPDNVPGFIAQYGAVGDISAHDNDVRGALGLPADREGEARDISYEAQVFLLQARANDADVPAVRFVTERAEHVVGKGDVTATIDVDWFEFLRALGGRRSADQIREMFGNVNAKPYLPIISSNPLPTGRLEV